MPIARNVCRLCMSNKELVLVFDQRLDEKMDMKNVILVTAGVEICETDLISQKICATCQQVTEKIYQFRQRAQKTDKLLKDQLCEEIMKLPDSEVTTNQCVRLSNADVANTGTNPGKKIPVSEGKLPKADVIANTSVNSNNSKPDLSLVEKEIIEVQEVTSKEDDADAPLAVEKNVEVPSTDCVQKEESLLSSPLRSEEAEESIQWAEKDVIENSTNAKVNVDVSVKNLFSNWPNLKLPDFALNYKFHPFVSLEIDFVEDYFQRNNLNMSKQVESTVKNYRKSLKQNANNTETKNRTSNNPIKKRKSKDECKKMRLRGKVQQLIEESSTKQDDSEPPTLMDTLKLLPKENVIRCNICNLPLSDDVSLEMHMKQHLQCPVCKTDFVSFDCRKEHDKQCLTKKCLEAELTIELTRLDYEKHKNPIIETIELLESDDEVDLLKSFPVKSVSSRLHSSTGVIRPVIEIYDNNLLKNLDCSAPENALLKEMLKSVQKQSISCSTPSQTSSPHIVECPEQKTAEIKNLLPYLNIYNKVPVKIKSGQFSVSHSVNETVPKKRNKLNISSKPIDVKPNKYFNSHNFRQRVKTGARLFAKISDNACIVNCIETTKQISNQSDFKCKKTNNPQSTKITAKAASSHGIPSERSAPLKTYSSKKIKTSHVTQNNSIPVTSVTTTNVQSPSLPVNNNQTLTSAKGTLANNVPVVQTSMLPKTIDVAASGKFKNFTKNVSDISQKSENVSAVKEKKNSFHNNLVAQQIQKPSSLKPINDGKLPAKSHNVHSPHVSTKKKESNVSQIPDNFVTSKAFEPEVSYIPVAPNVNIHSSPVNATNNSNNCESQSKAKPKVLEKSVTRNPGIISGKTSQPGVSSNNKDFVAIKKNKTTEERPKINSQSLPINNKPTTKTKNQTIKLNLLKSSKSSQPLVSSDSINSHVSQNTVVPQISTMTDSIVSNPSQMSANVATSTAAVGSNYCNVSQFNALILNNTYPNFGFSLNTIPVPQYYVSTNSSTPQYNNQTYNIGGGCTLQSDIHTYSYPQNNDTASIVTQNHLNYMPQTIQTFPTKSRNVLNQPGSIQYRNFPAPYVPQRAPNADKVNNAPSQSPSCSGSSNSVSKPSTSGLPLHFHGVGASGLSQNNSCNLPQSTPNALSVSSNISQASIQPVQASVVQSKGANQNLCTPSTSKGSLLSRYLLHPSKSQLKQKSYTKKPNVIRSEYKVLAIPNNIGNEQQRFKVSQTSASSSSTDKNLTTELPKLTSMTELFKPTKQYQLAQNNQDLSSYTKKTTSSNNTSLQNNFVNATTINEKETLLNRNINEEQKKTTFLRVKNLQDLK